MNSDVIKNPCDDNPDWMSDIDIEEYEKLASIGYAPKQIALYYNIPLPEFMYQFNMPFSKLAYHYKRGKLLQAAKEGMTMAADSASGQNAAQAARFDKLRQKNMISSAIDEIFFTDIQEV